MIFFMCFVLVAVVVQGKPPLELSPTSNLQDLFSHGVDTESCKRMVFQVQRCAYEGYHMYMLDQQGRKLVWFIIAGWHNTKSKLYVVPTNVTIYNTKRALLGCDEFRWFWMSWDADRIKFGTGSVPGENAIFDLEDSTGRKVKRVALSKTSSRATSVRFGETERGRFTRVLQDGKFSDGMILESSTSRETCVTLCNDHVDCGMFSYNQDLGLCAIFDRMMSSFNVTSDEGWRSWKLLYCYP